MGRPVQNCAQNQRSMHAILGSAMKAKSLVKRGCERAADAKPHCQATRRHTCTFACVHLVVCAGATRLEYSVGIVATYRLKTCSRRWRSHTCRGFLCNKHYICHLGKPG